MLFGSFRTVAHLNWRFLHKCCKQSFTDGAEVRTFARALYSSRFGSVELPGKRKKSERKPWLTEINEIKRISRMEKRERRIVRESILEPPENGLLVKELIPIAHEVFAARTRLVTCVSRVADEIPIFVCSVCGDVHVGDPPHKIKTCNVSGSQKNKEHTWARGGADHVFPAVDSFHLYDRLGRAVSHNERLEVDRIPAIVELCIQAGLDIPIYPTRRREFPVYRVAGRMIDFEKRFPKNDISGKYIKAFGFWHIAESSGKDHKHLSLTCTNIKEFSERGMKALETLRYGVGRLMQKYPVQTCGYCSEVQVGPKGHRVRQCQAFKHQMRDGQHDWQEATIDDLVPPVYVWHVPDPKSSLLVDSLKRYYGNLPAVVELFAQAGARIGESYWSMMREDVVIPKLDEEKLVV
ncbi:APO protein 3, mitochondrial-like [Andrographis paniculata]|uniref:APO protein 3, mitochondrial-like n=1 Tax=Andrographis paniculata TaxID=175694 RepID=UPI0021E78807|nr:APO protein 3, mitochondrial-like [Andrographis paniculata]